MRRPFRPMPWQAWLASFVMLFHALVPGLMQMGGPAMVEVCTAQGSKWIAVAKADGKPLDTTLSHGLDHCQTGCCQLLTPPLPQPGNLTLAKAEPDATSRWFPPTRHAVSVFFTRPQSRAPPVPPVLI